MSKKTKYKIGDKVYSRAYFHAELERGEVVSVSSKEVLIKSEEGGHSTITIGHQINDIYLEKEVLYTKGLIVVLSKKSKDDSEQLKQFKALAEKFGYELEG